MYTWGLLSEFDELEGVNLVVQSGFGDVNALDKSGGIKRRAVGASNGASAHVGDFYQSVSADCDDAIGDLERRILVGTNGGYA